ncbi:MAG: alpha/beta fold hydrolase [Geminicoccaceae bacterium]
MQAERLRIKVVGHELAVLRLRLPAPSRHPPLLFLHEGLGSIAQWKDFPSALCARLGCEGIVFDRLGHGRSDPAVLPRTPTYLHEAAGTVLPALLDALAVPRAALLGHSDGGSIALLFAAVAPERTAALVTEAAHVMVEEITLAGIRAAGAAYATTDLPRRLARYHGEKTEALFYAWRDTWLSPAFRGWNIEAALPAIRAPLLVIQGEADEYGSPAQVEAIARGTGGPVERLLIPGCGHNPHQEARMLVLERAAAFLGGAAG